MALTPGTRLGVYQVTAQIGEGGMGQVYRARDTKLDRDVAIKILPEAFAHDSDRLARFQREAKTLASLNHPNIAAIYGLEESGGMTALVMELVEGEDLSQRIARGAIPLDDALPIAKQIAEALEAAHEQGIIHRDLKPANIKVRSDGTMKVLDFGLAKALEPTAASSANATHSPTLSLQATQAGIILGTAAYMSPEQAKGRAADKRSDVWAFGCVLYEMLTGTRAFEGEDVSDTLAAVLRGAPDWTALPADVPPVIRTLVQRCLEKDRRARIADISTALFLMKELREMVANLTQRTVPPRPLWRRAILVLGAVVVTGALSVTAALYVKPSTPLTITRFPITLAEGQQFTATAQQLVAISPDGTQMVYVANNRLYLRSMPELEARPIPGTEGPQGVLFSPDGRSIAFWSLADQTIKKIAVSGGAAVTICPADNPFGMSWGADGIVFGQGSKGVMRVSANGGKPELLVSVKGAELAHGPQLLPGGQTVLFTLATGTDGDRWDKAHIVVQTLRSGERKTLIEGGSDARYLPTGHIVYALGGVVFAVPFDLKRLEVTGGPIPILEGVRRASVGTTPGTAQFSFSDTGSLIYIPGPTGTRTTERAVALADRAGVVTRLTVPAGPYAHIRVSRDGTRLAVGSDDGKEAIVWIYRLGGASAMQRLTIGGKNRFPIWSADGQRVAFQSDREGDLAIFWQRADGTGPVERLTRPEQGEAHVPESWSPDGRHVSFSVAKGSGFSLWTLSVEDKKATPYGGVRSGEPIGSAFSPDGQWIAYSSNAPGARFFSSNGGVYIQPFPATGAIYQVPKKGRDFHPVWAADGAALIYVPTAASGQLAAVSVTTRPGVTFGSPVSLPARVTADRISSEMRAYDILPDGRFIGLVNSSEPESSRAAAPEILVVLNWFEELKARVPTK